MSRLEYIINSKVNLILHSNRLLLYILKLAMVEKIQERDWGYISKVKAEHDQKTIDNEKQKAKTDKKIYKKELDGQAFLKEIQYEEFRKMKDMEAKRIHDELRNFEQDERMRKEKEFQRQLELSKMLDNHKSLTKNSKEQLKALSAREDQRYMDLIQEKLREEERIKKEKRDLEYKLKEDMKNMLSFQQRVKAQEKEKEKELEKRIIDERKLVDEKREQEHQIFFQMLKEKQQKNTINFSEKTLVQNQEKDLLIDQWINKSMLELQKKQGLEAREAQQKKQVMIRETQNSLKEHLELKEAQRRREALEKERQFKEALNSNQTYRNDEMERQMMEKRRKVEYLQQLKSQEALTTRLSPDQLSDVEKKINRAFVSDISLTPKFQMQANNILGSPSHKGNMLYSNEIAGTYPFSTGNQNRKFFNFSK